MRVGLGVASCAGVICAAIVLTGVVGASSARTHPPGNRVDRFGERALLGSLSPATNLRLELTLANRNDAQLGQLIASGRTVTPSTYTRRFLPTTSSVLRAIRRLELAGLRVTWTPGAAVLGVTGSAAAAERVFGVRLDRYRSADGEIFYAPTRTPRLQPGLKGVVSVVAGLDDSHHLRDYAAPVAGDPPSGCAMPSGGIGGYTPSQVLSAYHFGPLLSDAMTGAGQTVVFLEIDTFAASDLRCFASQFGEPAFNVTAAPQNWGSPDTSTHDEADVDLEIVHSIAPRARLVVYYASSSGSDIAAAAAAAVKAYPTAIFSVSVGGCEWEQVDAQGNPIVAADEAVWHGALRQLAATGGTALIASGDSGAYTCGKQVTTAGGAEAPTVSSPADDPYATAVGGTTLFVGTGGTYVGEAAWANPFEAAGTGGGLSVLWQRPPWQAGAGVQNQYSDGHRQLPDVSALGDENTGWDTFFDGSWRVVAGTSAAAPLWGGLTALADQTLARYGLPRVGFANPILYGFAQNPRRLPAAAFNDITRGENLYYPATPGWDYATGLGTPNAAGILDDLLHYRETHR